MKLRRLSALLFMGPLTAAALAQTPAQTTPPAAPPAAKAPAPARPAPKALSQVDQVIELAKAGMTEDFIINKLRKAGKPIDLTTAEVLKLKAAKVSENVMNVMMDPKSAPVAAAVPEPPPPPPLPAVATTTTITTTTAPAAAPVTTVSTVVTAAQRKRVIIDPFDYSTVSTAVQAVFGTNMNIGKGIGAMLSSRLTQQGKVVVVERAKIDVLTKEQDRNKSGRVKQGTGARVGGISGADALLTGDIVVFGRDDKKKGGAGAGVISGLRGICSYCAIAGAAASAFKKEEKAVIVINYKFIDAETSEVLSSGEARGESKRTSMNMSAFAGAFGKGAGAAQVDMTSSNFAETIIGEATQDCVNKLADIFSTQAEVMKKTVRDVEAHVADVSGNTLMISAGSPDGVNTGDVFDVFHIDREVKDPVTHEVIDQAVTKVGDLTITQVREKISSGTYSGSAPAIGFLVRKKLPAQ